MSELDEALAATEAALMDAQERQRALADEIKQLEVERVGLQGAVARRRGERRPAEVSRSRQEEWQRLSRTDAIVRLLVEQNRPLSPADLSYWLQERGRSGDNPTLVSAALNHLRNQHRVESLGRAQWVVRKPQGSSDPVTEAAS